MQCVNYENALVAKSEEELRQQLEALQARMRTVLHQTRRQAYVRLERLMACRVFREPHRLVQARQQYVDDLLSRLEKGWQDSLHARQHQLQQSAKTLVRVNPRTRWQRLAVHVQTLQNRLDAALRSQLTLHREHLNGLGSTLHSLSPLAVLGRGYSLCRDLDTQRLVTSIGAVQPGQQVEVVLSDGALACTVDTMQQRESDGGRFDLRASLEALRGNRRGSGNGKP